MRPPVNSSTRGRRTVSAQLRREWILDVADLASLPRGQAVLFASGKPEALLATVHWTDMPYAEQVRARVAYYGAPSGAPPAPDHPGR